MDPLSAITIQLCNLRIQTVTLPLIVYIITDYWLHGNGYYGNLSRKYPNIRSTILP